MVVMLEKQKDYLEIQLWSAGMTRLTWKIKRGLIAITVKKSEVIENSKDVATVPSLHRRSNNDSKGNSENESGVVLLFIVVMDTDLYKKQLVWTEEYIRKLKDSKTNILDFSK